MDSGEPRDAYERDPLLALEDVAVRIARLEARLDAVMGERDQLANQVTMQERELTELAGALTELSRVRHDARDAVDGILRMIGSLESRLSAQRRG